MRTLVLASAACAVFAVPTLPAAARGQDSTAADKPWYDRLSMRGYAQFRYNRLLETNEKLKCSTCDRSIGENGGFFLRRARLVVTGRVNDRISVSIQPDFASEVGGRENALVLRHYYADIYLDGARTVRARIGQSEVTTGFEAIQSSSRRAPFDRADAIESAAPGEQDLGIFVMWAPAGLKQRLRDLATTALKGTGDYGVVTVGAYNGQGGNRADQSLHFFVAGVAGASHADEPGNVQDVCVVWGESIVNGSYRKVQFWSGEFTCSFAWSSAISPPFKPETASNNHLLPADAAIARQIGAIQVGDQIRMAGLLVDYKVTRDGREIFTRHTSLTRGDTGNGACEILYVTALTLVAPGDHLRASAARYCGYASVALLVGVVALWLARPPRAE